MAHIILIMVAIRHLSIRPFGESFPLFEDTTIARFSEGFWAGTCDMQRACV
jgi:hypothetical protein